jgi:26S proteasome regulatory subunit N9
MAEFLEGQIAAYPDLAEQYQKLGDLYTRKLWHQLTTEVLSFCTSCGRDQNLIQLYDNFITLFEGKIKQLSLILIAELVNKQNTDLDKAVAFMDSLAEKKERLGDEALLHCKSVTACLKLQQGKSNEVKVLISANQIILDGLQGADPAVHSKFYQSASEYYKVNGPAETYYKNALMYLAYTPLDTLTLEQKQVLATDLALAALTGENVFNFGEVLATPILSALEGTPNAWLFELCSCFNHGDIDKFNEVVNANQQAFNSQPALANNNDYVKSKVTLLCLINLFFQRPAHDRNVPFSDISEATRLPVEEIEWLLMRAMSLKLIKGSIDQIDQRVEISWVMPRVLDNTQISQMNERLKEWGSNVNKTLMYVEDQTPELFQ